MENFYTTTQSNEFDNNLSNIILINNHAAESEEEDYDLDYDPNEMYYALNKRD